MTPLYTEQRSRMDVRWTGPDATVEQCQFSHVAEMARVTSFRYILWDPFPLMCQFRMLSKQENALAETGFPNQTGRTVNHT